MDAVRLRSSTRYGCAITVSRAFGGALFLGVSSCVPDQSAKATTPTMATAAPAAISKGKRDFFGRPQCGQMRADEKVISPVPGRQETLTKVSEGGGGVWGRTEP